MGSLQLRCCLLAALCAIASSQTTLQKCQFSSQDSCNSTQGCLGSVFQAFDSYKVSECVWRPKAANQQADMTSVVFHVGCQDAEYTCVSRTSSDDQGACCRQHAVEDISSLPSLLRASKANNEESLSSDIEIDLKYLKHVIGIPDATFTYTEDQLMKQSEYGGSVNFLEAVYGTTLNIIDEPAGGPDGSTYNAATAVRENIEEVPEDADDATVREYIRNWVNKQSMVLMDESHISYIDLAAMLGAGVDEYWMFSLEKGFGDWHWVVLRRDGTERPKQLIT